MGGGGIRAYIVGLEGVQDLQPFVVNHRVGEWERKEQRQKVARGGRSRRIERGPRDPRVIRDLGPRLLSSRNLACVKGSDAEGSVGPQEL